MPRYGGKLVNDVPEPVLAVVVATVIPVDAAEVVELLG
jgi:hypothetical protein